jgi:hypothetical protein
VNSPLIVFWARNSLLISILGPCELASHDHLRNALLIPILGPCEHASHDDLRVEFPANFNTRSLWTHLSWSFEQGIPCEFQYSVLVNPTLMIIWARNSLRTSIFGPCEPNLSWSFEQGIPCEFQYSVLVNPSLMIIWARNSLRTSIFGPCEPVSHDHFSSQSHDQLSKEILVNPLILKESASILLIIPYRIWPSLTNI